MDVLPSTQHRATDAKRGLTNHSERFNNTKSRFVGVCF